MRKPPPALVKLAFHADFHFDALSRRVRRRLGLAPPLRILPYRGFGSPHAALVKARVVEDRWGGPVVPRRSLAGSALASWRRFMTLEIPHARVRATWGSRSFEGTTDEEGFLELPVEPPPGVASGWHEVRLTLPGPEGLHCAPALAPVRVTGPEAEYGVISDLDDTVIVTQVASPLMRAWALFLPEHRGRQPFEGVQSFYGALQAGASGHAGNPLFYVSSSPWNLYEHLEAFLSVHGIPAGPLLLRDWGLSREGFAPGGGHGHKLEKMEGVLRALPRLRFVLIGDSGQEDAEHYLTVARRHPGRVACVYIRKVWHRRGREAELERLAAEVRAAGSQLVVVADTAEAAGHAAAQGYIRREG